MATLPTRCADTLLWTICPNPNPNPDPNPNPNLNQVRQHPAVDHLRRHGRQGHLRLRPQCHRPRARHRTAAAQAHLPVQVNTTYILHFSRRKGRHGVCVPRMMGWSRQNSCYKKSKHHVMAKYHHMANTQRAYDVVTKRSLAGCVISPCAGPWSMLGSPHAPCPGRTRFCRVKYSFKIK